MILDINQTINFEVESKKGSQFAKGRKATNLWRNVGTGNDKNVNKCSFREENTKQSSSL